MAVETKARRVKNRITTDLSGPPATKDDIRSLPATVEWLRREGLLLETDVEVDGELQLTGIQKQLDGTLPILFNKIAGYPNKRVVTNLFSSIEIIDRMFGWPTPQERTRRLAHALTHPIPPEVIESN